MAPLAAIVSCFGMDTDAAFCHPRINVSGGNHVSVDQSLPQQALDRRSELHQLRTTFACAFACPAGVMREGPSNSGCTEIMSPWGGASVTDPA